MTWTRPMTPRQKKAYDVQTEIFRRMTPGERIDCALRWTAMTLDIQRSQIRKAHPDWTPLQIDREIGRRITGIDVWELERKIAAKRKAAEDDNA